jgi:hypothetical protein
VVLISSHPRGCQDEEAESGEVLRNRSWLRSALEGPPELGEVSKARVLSDPVGGDGVSSEPGHGFGRWKSKPLTGRTYGLVITRKQDRRLWDVLARQELVKQSLIPIGESYRFWRRRQDRAL